MKIEPAYVALTLFAAFLSFMGWASLTAEYRLDIVNVHLQYIDHATGKVAREEDEQMYAICYHNRILFPITGYNCWDYKWELKDRDAAISAYNGVVRPSPPPPTILKKVLP